MKKISTILSAILLVASVIAQSPQKMSYQAVVRDANGKLVTSHAVGIKVSILQGSVSGSSVYSETQTTTTNANGLISIEIGGGTGFNAIDWANGSYFIKTETDPTGGASYTISGTSQLLSVPYALYAKTAGNGFSGNFNDLSNKPTEADPIFGAWNKSSGISITASQVSDFQTSVTNNSAVQANTAKNSYPTADATKLAGIAAGAEVNVNADWNATSGDAQILNKPTIPAAANGSETKVTAGTNVTVTGTGTTLSPYVVNATEPYYLGQEKDGGIIFYIYPGSDGLKHGLIVSKTESIDAWQNPTSLVGANRTWDGAYNTNLMTNSPAKTWVTSLGTGWYLPSIDELGILWHNRFHVNKALKDGGFTLLWTSYSYWSSTEVDATSAYFINFSYGSPNVSPNKLSAASYRAVRAF